MSTKLQSALNAELSAAHFTEISRRVYQICRINLQTGKEGLVKSRLEKRLRHLNLDSFDDYLAYVDADRSGSELRTMIDVLTTNKTSFFREAEHFEFLRHEIFPKLKSGSRKLRLWSAGCSYGNEPYTIAMLMREDVADIDRCDVRLLATDISARVLATARAGRYEDEMAKDIPAPLLKKYFTKVPGGTTAAYQVNDNVKKFISFARLNLMDKWPMSGPFDAIFCRNVMIYFDKPTQAQLISRFHEMLIPGGHLFIGHSESLGRTSEFRYVQPALYVK